MPHKSKVGQLVRLKARFPDETGARIYEVVRQLPPAANGVPCYRIKGGGVPTERAVDESQLDPASK